VDVNYTLISKSAVYIFKMLKKKKITQNIFDKDSNIVDASNIVDIVIMTPKSCIFDNVLFQLANKHYKGILVNFV